MTHRRLRRGLFIYRVGDPRGRHPIYSGAGAASVAGRWHELGQYVIYAAEHFSTALLERLVYFNQVLPKGQHYIKITVPAGVTYEVCTRDTAEGWSTRNSPSARAFGAAWLREGRSCLLFVPSRVSREEQNILINPAHADFSKLDPGLEIPVTWDERLFADEGH